MDMERFIDSFCLNLIAFGLGYTKGHIHVWVEFLGTLTFIKDRRMAVVSKALDDRPYGNFLPNIRLHGQLKELDKGVLQLE